MTQSRILLAKILTYSGTIPFVIATIIQFFPVRELESLLIAQTYSAIIISFLCGIHWAIYLFFFDKCPRNLFITSNIVALLAWSSLLISPPVIGILLQSLCFLYLLVLDLGLRNAGALPEWFYLLRRNATIIVVLCLLILLVTV